MEKVESFELDHRYVKAPYVRKCCTLSGKNGDKITKFDLRFVQPNTSEMPTGAMHTIEHLLANYLREFLDEVIDLSPMGCRTGFYLTLWNDRNENEVRIALEKSLKKVITTECVPATNEIQCGNFRDHSLFAAKEYAKLVLKNGINENYIIKNSK
ncbi:S-ribosylhomocysteine lyase [Clostridium rectalis]|uniref:S-ribosylhomocysteine lyase n=1 Tax=Clostridium rectalis TaxID=2040295 RepID=UPI000F640B6B|nr:S-ribosylhomocysteine lyase [Clostridium rectalis]